MSRPLTLYYVTDACCVITLMLCCYYRCGVTNELCYRRWSVVLLMLCYYYSCAHY